MRADTPGNPNVELAELRARVRVLEDALKFHGLLATQAPAPPPAPPLPQSSVAPLLAGEGIAPPLGPSPAPQFDPLHAPAPLLGTAALIGRPADRSLENRIGSQWFNRVGILAVLIAAGWFLKLAIDNHWIGPLGRVLIGLLSGAGALAWAERFRRHNYKAFSYSLQAVGSGILYLSLWAAFSLFHLVPASVAFAAMIAVTAFNGYMAWLHDAELLALYSIVGGLSTPLLLSTGQNHEITLFGYLLLLDTAVLTLTILRPWSRILFSAFTGTVLFITAWWLSYYSDAAFALTFLFVTCFFMLFAVAPRFIRLRPEFVDKRLPWDNLTLVVMPITNACLGFLAYYQLFHWTVPAGTDSWSGALIAVALAAFYLLLLRMPARGMFQTNSPLGADLCLTTVVVFLALAVPLKAHGRWLTIGWLIEGAALLWTARRARLSLLLNLGVICLALGLAMLIVSTEPASLTPLLNARFACFCVALAIFGFILRLAQQIASEPLTDPASPWRVVALAAVIVINGLILLAVSREIHSFWWYRRWHGDWQLFHEYRVYAQFTYSAFFMLFGAVLLLLGFRRASTFIRWQALLLLAFTIGKVFLVDVSQLSQGYRILSFLGLGVLLLAVSFVYQRDLLHLRDDARSDT